MSRPLYQDLVKRTAHSLPRTKNNHILVLDTQPRTTIFWLRTMKKPCCLNSTPSSIADLSGTYELPLVVREYYMSTICLITWSPVLPGLSLHIDGVIPGRYALQAQYELVLLPRNRHSVDQDLHSNL